MVDGGKQVVDRPVSVIGGQLPTTELGSGDVGSASSQMRSRTLEAVVAVKFMSLSVEGLAQMGGQFVGLGFRRRLALCLVLGGRAA